MIADEYIGISDWKNSSDYAERLTKGDSRDFTNLWYMDKYLHNLNGFVAGGAFKNIFTGKAPRDLDVYFRNEMDYHAAVVELKANEHVTKTYENDNAMGFKFDDGLSLELIHRIYGTPEEIISYIDFTIDKFAYVPAAKITSNSSELLGTVAEGMGADEMASSYVVYHNKFFEHLTQHRVVVDGWLQYPLSTYNRLFKYATYGFLPCRQTKVEIARFIQRTPTVHSADDIALSMYDGMD